ncbi:hypothetical protein [Poseidonocella sp. HB161398]|uniref:hypothetical protein n=1 Tax=Poseidonocella sp. HB161398 TaxID=2320855 RepID=UPI001108A41D|nr:hypothetical protein [Poseidonocella sp. HB161398]
MSLQTELERGAGRAVHAAAAAQEEARRKLAETAEHAGQRGAAASRTVAESQREMIGHMAEAMTGTMEKLRDAMQDFAGKARDSAHAVADGSAEAAASAKPRKPAPRSRAKAQG